MEGVPIYATPGDLPSEAVIGTVVSVVSDKTIRQWDGAVWQVVGGAGAIASVGDTNSIDLTVTLGTLTADLKLSAAAATAGSTIVNLDIQADGLRAQIANSAIQSLVSVTDTDSIDLTYTSGAISGVLKLSSNAADANNTIVALDVESTGVVGLRAQIPNASVRGLISATAPVAYNNTTGVISMPVATSGADGYLSSADWTTFNSKVSTTRAINTTAPLTGGGNLSADRTLAIAASTNAVDGYLTAADHTTFAAKVGPTRAINTTAPITGGGDLSADRTLAMAAATGAVDGYLTAANFTIFNGKQAAITVGAIGAGDANGLTLVTGTLTLHVGTATQPGAVSTAAQVFAGAKTFNANIIKTNDTTNASFVADVTPSTTGATATNGQTAVGSFDTDYMLFMIEIGTERNAILCQADYTSANISFISDKGNYGLLTDAGTGIYVSKSATSANIFIKNRMGASRVIRIKAIGSAFTSTTAWA